MTLCFITQLKILSEYMKGNSALRESTSRSHEYERRSSPLVRYDSHLHANVVRQKQALVFVSPREREKIREARICCEERVGRQMMFLVVWSQYLLPWWYRTVRSHKRRRVDERNKHVPSRPVETLDYGPAYTIDFRLEGLNRCNFQGPQNSTISFTVHHWMMVVSANSVAAVKFIL
jgi:hypothetical protein